MNIIINNRTFEERVYFCHQESIIYLRGHIKISGPLMLIAKKIIVEGEVNVALQADLYGYEKVSFKRNGLIRANPLRVNSGVDTTKLSSLFFMMFPSNLIDLQSPLSPQITTSQIVTAQNQQSTKISSSESSSNDLYFEWIDQNDKQDELFLQAINPLQPLSSHQTLPLSQDPSDPNTIFYVHSMQPQLRPLVSGYPTTSPQLSYFEPSRTSNYPSNMPAILPINSQCSMVLNSANLSTRSITPLIRSNNLQSASIPQPSPIFINYNQSELDQKKKKRRKVQRNSIAIANKICDWCKTTKTSLWRKGQDNKYLCNACGLKYAKKLKKERFNNSQDLISKLTKLKPLFPVGTPESSDSIFLADEDEQQSFNPNIQI